MTAEDPLRQQGARTGAPWRTIGSCPADPDPEEIEPPIELNAESETEVSATIAVP